MRNELKTESFSYRLVISALRVALILGLFSAGWFIYRELPPHDGRTERETANSTVQILLQQSPDMNGITLDIPIELYPVDIVAVRHEFFTERRAGKRFDDFLNERMNGRTPISARLDKQGQTSLIVSQGNWWIHAVLSGEVDLEWRLPINVHGRKQLVELTTQNAYTRTKTF